MRAAEAIATLEELGSTQRGLITTSQAEQYGISRVTLGRLRDRGLIHQARRGIYSLPSAGIEPLQDLHAAWLGTAPTELGEQRLDEPDVAVSHFSAAQVHQLGDLVASLHEFTSSSRRRSSHPDVRIHRGDLPSDDVTVVDGLPVTSIPRTVGDIADDGVDLDHLAGVVRDALSSPQVRPRDLAQRLNWAATRHGFTNGNALVEACLERAGLPAVAENLSSTMEALLRALGGNEIRGLMQKAFGDQLAEQRGALAAVQTDALRQLMVSGALEAMQLPQAHHSTSAIAAASQNMLGAIRSPALDATLKSTGSTLMQGMDPVLRGGMNTMRHVSAGNASPTTQKENSGNDETQTGHPPGPEDVSEGEAERGGP